MINTAKEFTKSLVSQLMKISTSEIDLLREHDAFITRKTNENDLCALIQELHPIHDKSHDLIRLGPNGDGGYLIPDDLSDIEACYSPGVDQVSGFEMDCANLGMKVFLADKSVKHPPETHELFKFTQKFLGSVSNEGYITMDEWVESTLPNSTSDLLLQMDIEGAEYETLLSTSNILMQRFRIIVVEFHKIDQLWSQSFFSVASSAFMKILETHSCVHIHPNNCCGSVTIDGIEIPRAAEFTFYRKDRIDNPVPAKVFPNPLDFDCVNQAPLPLPDCWY